MNRNIAYGRLHNRRIAHILGKGEPVCGSAMHGRPYITVSDAEYKQHACARCRKLHSAYAV